MIFRKKNKKTAEYLIRNHNRFNDSYKIVGCVIPSKDKFDFDGELVSFQVAAIMLAIKYSIGDIDNVEAWRSPSYKLYDDAANVLQAECRRLADVIDRRFEVIEYDENSGKHEITEVYNSDNRRYLLIETNL